MDIFIMIIGIPCEIGVLAGRVGLIPTVAGQLVSQGHQLLVEQSRWFSPGYGASSG